MCNSLPHPTRVLCDLTPKACFSMQTGSLPLHLHRCIWIYSSYSPTLLLRWLVFLPLSTIHQIIFQCQLAQCLLLVRGLNNQQCLEDTCWFSYWDSMKEFSTKITEEREKKKIHSWANVHIKERLTSSVKRSKIPSVEFQLSFLSQLLPEKCLTW